MSRLLDKYSNMSIQAKSAIWFTICNILQKGISFLTVPIFTRLLTTDQYGTYSLYLSWLDILSIITSLYLFNGVLNNAMMKFDNDRDRYISSMQGLTITISSIVFCFFLCFQTKWEMLLALPPIYIYMMFLEALVIPALNYWSCKQRFEYKYKKLVCIILAKSIANPVIGVIAVLVAKDKALARVSSIVIVEVVFCGGIMALQFVKGGSFFNKLYWQYAIKMGVPLLPHYLSGLILNQADRIMIEKMVGRTEVALYSVAYNIGMLVQVFTLAIGNAITPWFYQRLKDKEYKRIGNTINSLLLLVSCISFGLMLCSPEFVLILGSSKYINAVYVIPPVAASVFFVFLYNLLSIPQFYYEQNHYMLIASSLAAFTNIVLNYIFIDLFGYVAAGYTTLVCYIVYSLGHFIISSRLINNHSFGMANEVFNKRIMLLLSLVTIVFGIGCNELFNYVVIRYLILSIGIIVAVCFRGRILDLLSRIKED